jgi:TldD protein
VSSADAPFPGLEAELGTTILRKAMQNGGDSAELYVEERRSLALRLEDGKIEDALSGVDRGGSVRLIRGLSTAFGYVDAVDEGSLLSVAGELSRSQTGSPGKATTLALVHSAFAGLESADPGAVDVNVKARLLHLADETARGLSAEVRQVIASYSESVQKVWIAGSHGSLATDSRTRVTIGVMVMAARDGLIQTGRETLAYQGAVDLPQDEAVVAVAKEAAEKALVMLDSKPAPAGRMPVVLANGFGGVLFHEACGHGLEADYILKKASVWAGKKGLRVAGAHVFAYDDGVGPGMWGSAGCDDEGTPCERTVVIQAGILTGYLTDRLRGGHLGLPLTGNGRRQDYRHLPYPRMTNTYFGPGLSTAEEIIADTPRALYAKSLSGGQVNPVTGEFVFGVAEGYLIENGRVGGPVRGATLVGNGPEVLQGIDAIADDLDVKAGMCGKEGQSVPVGTGQPTVRIRELTVGGTNL